MRNTNSLTRSNTLPSFDSASLALGYQMHGAALPPGGLSDHAPTSQFNVTTDDITPLTPTQIAAFEGQPLPPDHPYYSEVRAHIHDHISGTASQGESTSPPQVKDFHFLTVVVDSYQAILLTERQNMIPRDIVLRDLFSVPLST